MHAHATRDDSAVQARTARAAVRPPLGSPALLRLQRVAGNRAVTAMLAPKPAVQRCGDVPADQCGCHGDHSDARAPTGAVHRDATSGPATSGTTFDVRPAQTHRINGRTPAEIQNAMAGLGSGGHVEVETDWTGDDRNGRVANPHVTVSLTKHAHVWGSGRDAATEAHRTTIESFFELISAHEDRHVARNRAAFAGAHVGLSGKTAAEAQAHMDGLACRAGRSDEALDAAEGCVRFGTNYQGAELVGLSTCGHPAADYTSDLTCPST